MILYLRLIQQIGLTRSMTVTFLIRVWGVFWSALLLDEPVTATKLAACGLVLTGTMLVVAGHRRALPTRAR